MTSERIYSVEEADAMLPELRERLGRIRDARKVLFRGAELVRDQVAADGGGVHPAPAYREASGSLRRELERLSEEAIALRDPESGLVDFPGERDGERVWLCWRVGEDRVAHWHPLDTGVAGRRPL